MGETDRYLLTTSNHVQHVIKIYQALALPLLTRELKLLRMGESLVTRLGTWYRASIGIVLHRDVDSLATLPAVGTSDSKSPAIGNEGKLLGFLASLESLAAEVTVFSVNAKLISMVRK